MSERWAKHDMEFLGGSRQRRLRGSQWMRELVRETVLTPADLIWPLFVIDGQNERAPVKSMPGVERLSVDLAVAAAREYNLRGRKDAPASAGRLRFNRLRRFGHYWAPAKP